MRALIAILVIVLLGASAHASETITYTYDALGRLVSVSHSGTVNNGASATYSYDPANNRTNVTTASGGGGMAQTQSPAAKPDQPRAQSGAANAAPRR